MIAKKRGIRRGRNEGRKGKERKGKREEGILFKIGSNNKRMYEEIKYEKG